MFCFSKVAGAVHALDALPAGLPVLIRQAVG